MTQLERKLINQESKARILLSAICEVQQYSRHLEAEAKIAGYDLERYTEGCGISFNYVGKGCTGPFHRTQTSWTRNLQQLNN